MLNQRLRLMLSMALMDMVLDTLPTPDLSMEDTPPTPDQSYPAMLPDQLFPPLDTLPTLDQSMEDTPAIMARERLRLNQRLMLMLSMATMDMVLDTLPTPDLSMEDTPPTPDQLSPAAARPVVSSIGYSTYSIPVYGGYSSYYGKRDAEAEPEADAQYLGYSGLYGGYSSYARPIVSSVYSRPVVSSVYSR